MLLNVPEEAAAVVRDFADGMEMPANVVAEMYLLLGAMTAVSTCPMKRPELIAPFLARYRETMEAFEEKLRWLVRRN